MRKLRTRLAGALSLAMCLSFIGGSIINPSDTDVITVKGQAIESGVQTVKETVTSGDAITGDAVSGEAVTNGAVVTRVADEEGNIQFEVTRDKNSYEFGEDIILDIKATNISGQTITVISRSGTLGSAGGISIGLENLNGEQLFNGWYMNKVGNTYNPIGVLTDDVCYSEMASGEFAVGYQKILTLPQLKKMEGDYNIRITLKCILGQMEDCLDIEKEVVKCSVLIPVHMSDGEDVEIVYGSTEEYMYELVDAQDVLKTALKIIDLEDSEWGMEADFNKNGIIDLSDANHMLKLALKIINPFAPESNGDKSIWKEIPIAEDSNVFITCGMGTFDLQTIKKETDYVFRGTVVDRKQYEIFWGDENGEAWGPYIKSVIEVRIDEEYYGTSPVTGDTIKIYYPMPLDADKDGNFWIKDGAEYVFITKAFDAEFIEERNKNPRDRYEHEKHADCYISDCCYDVMAVEDGNVIFYEEYFAGNEAVTGKFLSEETLKTDKMTSEYLLKNFFAALKLEDFEEAFPNIFK